MLLLVFDCSLNVIAQRCSEIADEHRQKQHIAQVLQLAVNHDLQQEYLVTEANTGCKRDPGVVLPRKLLVPLPLLEWLPC